jgi:WD40 repeat protein
LRPFRKGVWRLAFSPDGSLLAAASLDGTITLLDSVPLRRRLAPAAAAPAAPAAPSTPTR